MYEKILNDPLRFGDEFGEEAISILTGLLNRDPSRRLGVKGAEEIKKHPFFHNHIDFKLLAAKKLQPPFKPSVASPVVSFSTPPIVMQLTMLQRMYPTLTWCSRKRPLSIAMSRVPIYLPPFRLNLVVSSAALMLLTALLTFYLQDSLITVLLYLPPLLDSFA